MDYLAPSLPTLTESAILWIAALVVIAFGGLANTPSNEVAVPAPSQRGVWLG